MSGFELGKLLVYRRKLSLKATLESSVPSAETKGAFNSDFDTTNLHRPILACSASSMRSIS